MNFAIKRLGYETDLKEEVLKEINDFFKPIKERF